MRITPIQFDISWANKKANLLYVEQLLTSLKGVTDLVVLPEMFSTGFCVENLELAEGMEGETVSLLRKWAIEFEMAITGSFLAVENGNYYNRAFFVFPSGAVSFADKRHLFTMAGEDKYITAGNDKLIVNYKGFNILVLVCYDVRFPVWTRNVGNAYDLLIYVANFPHKRIADWDILLRARAIENQCYLCGVNRVGNDGKDFAHSGHSVVLDYKSNEILSYKEYAEACKTAEIDMETLQKYRSRYAFWRDADFFTITQDQ